MREGLLKEIKKRACVPKLGCFPSSDSKQSDKILSLALYAFIQLITHK